MDLAQAITKVKTLDDYKKLTDQIFDKNQSFELHLNANTAIALKNIVALEVEYLKKYKGNGVAIVIYERLLTLPASRSWAMLGKELVRMLRYWLSAIRTYLIIHSDLHSAHWWQFLKLILKLINIINTKDLSIPNMLVELTSEHLFDISTLDILDQYQKHEILHCLNKYSTNCSRELRKSMQNSIDFIKYYKLLGKALCDSGYLPLQFTILETLLRWLVNRAERSSRQFAATNWFPPQLPDAARDIFIDNKWANVHADSRKFLNALNEASGRVTSVLCKTFTIGDTSVATIADKHRTWLDVNTTDNSMTVLLLPKVSRSDMIESLRIHRDITEKVQLISVSNEIELVIITNETPRLIPSNTTILDACSVTAVVSSSNDFIKLDQALTRAFADKYKLNMDLNKSFLMSPRPVNAKVSNDSDSRFSESDETRNSLSVAKVSKGLRRLSSGDTPSSVSTSSLMQLRDRLEALPKKNLFSKERGDICARTQLSSVSEISEFDDVSSVSTLVLGRSGVCQRPAKTPYSDGELIKPSFQVASNNNASCLLVATVGSEDSVINDTIERLSKSKDFDPTDIVDMLAREALQAGSNNFNTKLTANTHNITQDAVNTEVIDNTPIEKTKKPLKRNAAKKSCTIVSRSTTDDESNTEAVINDTPVYSNPRKGKFGHLLRKQYASKDHNDKHKTSIRAHKTPLEPKVIVEKIGSETSEECDTNYDLILNKQKFVHDENAVIECLNDMVSKVCKDINECLTYNPDYDVFNENREDTNTAKSVKKTTKSKTLKLILQAKKEKAPKKASSIKARDEPNVTEQNVSVLKEVNAEKTKQKSARNKDINEKQPKNVRATPKVPLTEKETETPQIKRKRKLYSPKDEIKITNTQEEEHDDVPLYKYKNIKKTKTASIYRDLERERELHTRKSLTRKRGQVEEPLSPRTLKMNAVFDSLKTLDSSEKVVQACPKTPLSIYAFNLSSESEDEVFVKKSSKMGKTTRSSRDGSTEPTKRCNIQIRKKNQKPHDDENKSKRKKPVSKTRSRTNLHIEPVNDLIDEKMRAGSAATATHKVIGKPKAKTIDIEPKLQDPPQLELIEETDAKEISKIPKRDKHSHTKHKILSNKDNQEANNTLSPLPGLVVESVPNRKVDDDTLTPAKIQKMLKIYHDNIDAVNISTNTQNTLLDNDNVIDIEENLEENQREKSKKRSNRDDRNKIIGKKPKTALNITNDVVEDFYNKELNDIISGKSLDQTDNREIDPILTYEIDEPPSPELIRQNRQIEDLNYSMVHLERGNESSKESTPEPAVRLERLSSEDISRWLPSGRTTRTSLSSQEPLVVLERLSSEDLSKWLPSQKTSETDCNSSIRDIINPECGLNQKQHETNIRKTSEKQNSQDIKTQKRKITPIVESTTISPFDINKITFEEFERMFPIPSTSKCNVGPIEKNDSQSVHNYNTRSKTKIRKSSSQESVHLKSVSHIRTKSSSLKEKIVPKTNNIILSHETDVPEHIPSNRPKTSLSKNKKSNIDSDEPKLSSTNKRTCISPIKSLEEFIMDKNNTPNSEEVQSEDDECVQTIRRLFAKKSDEPKPSSTNKRTCISPIKSLEQFIMDKNNTPNPEEVQSEDDECVQTIRRLFAKKSDEPKPSSTNKRTCISPIKSLEEFIMDKNNTPNPEEVQSEDDECVQTIRRLFAKKTVEAKTQEIQQCNTLKDMRSNSIVTQDQTKSQDSDKNKSDSDRRGRGSVLKEATDQMFTIHEPSTSRANDTFDSSKDSSHVLERNRNTIKKLLNLYTEIQVEFNIIKEEQRQFNEDRNKRLQNIYNAMMEEQRQQEKRCQEIIQKYEECLDNLKKLLADYL